MPGAINIAEWLPRCLEYQAGRERWFVLSTKATWPDFQRAKATLLIDRERARQRGQVRAYARHGARLVQYEAVEEMFAPLMADHPPRTFAEACLLLAPAGLKVVKEL